MDLSAAARGGHQLFLAEIPRPGPVWHKPPAPAPFRPPRFIQPVLVDVPRDMSQARAGNLTVLDASFSAHVIAAARCISSERGWPEWTWTALSWSLNLLTAVHRPDEMIKASTVLTFSDDGETGHEIGRVMDVLAELDLLLDDRPDVLGAWIDKRLAAVHPPIRLEVQTWVQSCATADNAAQPAKKPPSGRRSTTSRGSSPTYRRTIPPCARSPLRTSRPGCAAGRVSTPTPRRSATCSKPWPLPASSSATQPATCTPARASAPCRCRSPPPTYAPSDTPPTATPR
jgi:hypothetical protein